MSSLSSKLDRAAVLVGASLILATPVVLLAFGSGDGARTATAAPALAKVDRIVIRDFEFLPANDEIKVGTKLTFVNEDTAPHTATSSDGKAFDTAILNKGDEKAVTVTKPGVYAYICAVHPFMKATLKVVG